MRRSARSRRSGVVARPAIAVLTGADGSRRRRARHADKAAIPRKKKDGSPMFAPQRPALVVDRVRYVGDPVALVIARRSMRQATLPRLVEVDYEPLPSVTEVRSRRGAGRAPCGTRIRTTSRTLERGDRKATDVRRSRAPATSCAALRHHPRPCPVHGAARLDRPTMPATTATLTPTSTTRTAFCNLCWPTWCSKVPRAKSASSARMSAAASAPRGWQVCRSSPHAMGGQEGGRPVRWSCERSQVVMFDEHGLRQYRRHRARPRPDGKIPRAAAACWPASVPTSPPIASC